jgi:hypothetical protein
LTIDNGWSLFLPGFSLDLKKFQEIMMPLSPYLPAKYQQAMTMPHYVTMHEAPTKTGTRVS